MSRGLEARGAELARLCLSVGRIGRRGAVVVVNPVSSARSALAANRGLGATLQALSTPPCSNFGPLETSNCVKSSRVQTSGNRSCCLMHSRGGLTVLDFLYLNVQPRPASRPPEKTNCICLIRLVGATDALVWAKFRHIKAQPSPSPRGRYHFALALANLTPTTTHLIGPQLSSE